MNKLSLVGIQLPEEYKENFDVSSEGPSSGVSRTLVTPDQGPSRLETSKFSLYFSGSFIGPFHLISTPPPYFPMDEVSNILIPKKKRSKCRHKPQKFVNFPLAPQKNRRDQRIKDANRLNPSETTLGSPFRKIRP